MQPPALIPLDPATLTRLTRAAQDDGSEPLNEFLAAVRPYFVAYFARRLSLDVAEDLAQVALLRVVRALPRIDADRADCYVARVAQNLLRTATHRTSRDRRRYARGHYADRVASSTSVDGELECRELTDAIHRTSMNALPPTLRRVILALLAGQTTSEIARAECVSQITVRTRLLRARMLLRRELEAYLEPDHVVLHPPSTARRAA